jgi:hypothetical protein
MFNKGYNNGYNQRNGQFQRSTSPRRFNGNNFNGNRGGWMNGNRRFNGYQRDWNNNNRQNNGYQRNWNNNGQNGGYQNWNRQNRDQTPTRDNKQPAIGGAPPQLAIDNGNAQIAALN